VHLVITIDTEEDDWGYAWGRRSRVENIRRVPALQRLFDAFGVTPTYLVTYPVVQDETASSILRSIADSGRCEIGAHCHPWNTPPFAPSRDASRESMLCNLPSDLRRAKITRLHQTIERVFEVPPRSFRCGRWGFNSSLAGPLVDLGYRVETSVTPYINWSEEHGPDFSTTPPGMFHVGSDGLLEVPVTIGFLQSNFEVSNAILRTIQRRGLERLRPVGILNRLGAVNRVWLSPEVSTAAEMIALSKRMQRKNYRVLNLTFHSPSLEAGLTPFVRTRADEDRLSLCLHEYLTFARDAGITPVKLSAVPELLLSSV
jgi:hypothetical protein